MDNTIYTIGYSGFSIDSFIEMLKKHNIRLLIDVRSSPFSSFYSDYNKESLENLLRKNGIYYRNYASEFGARQNDKTLYHQDGYLDFDLFCESESFKSGISKLINSLEQGYSFALMCAEKDPIRCHRTIMVSRRFFEKGFNVMHLLPNGASKSQQQIEQELLDKFFPNREQITFFSDLENDSTLIPQAYRLQNAEIGYRMEDGSE